MKNINAILYGTAILFAAVSCDPAQNVADLELPGEVPGNLVDPANTVLSKSEIAERLDKIGEDLPNVIPVSEIERANDIFNDIREVDFSMYDQDELSDLESHFENKFESCWNEWGSPAMDFTEFTFEAAKFHGHVTFANGHVKFEDAPDLVVSIPSASGKPVVLKATHSDKTFKVHLREDGEYYYNYSERAQYQDDYYVNVPQQISLSLTYGGEQIVKSEINLAASISDNMPDISKDSFTVAMDLSVLGLNCNVERLQYEGKKLDLLMSLSYGSQGILAVSAHSENDNVNDIDGIVDMVESKTLEVTNTNVCLNFMERAQIIASMPSFKKFNKFLNLLFENDDDELQFKSYIGMINETFDGGLYFSSAIKQAKVDFEPVNYNGSRYWDMEPVIRFSDGTSYSTFSAFFNEVNFGKVMDAVGKWMEDIESIIY